LSFKIREEIVSGYKTQIIIIIIIIICNYITLIIIYFNIIVLLLLLYVMSFVPQFCVTQSYHLVRRCEKDLRSSITHVQMDIQVVPPLCA